MSTEIKVKDDGSQDSDVIKLSPMDMLIQELEVPETESENKEDVTSVVPGKEPSETKDALETKTQLTAEELAAQEAAKVKADEEAAAALAAAQQKEKQDYLEMIQTVRQMRQQMALANARLTRQDEELKTLREHVKTAGAVKVEPKEDEDDLLSTIDRKSATAVKVEPTVIEEVKVSELEQLQLDLTQIAQKRGEFFQNTVETMALNPQFADVKEVCSRGNLNDIVDAMAVEASKDYGVDAVTASLMVEKAIWTLENPYTWIYQAVKQNHPKYAKEDASKGDKSPTETSSADQTKTETKSVTETPGTTKKPVVIPPTIGESLSSSAPAGGFTAAALDIMDELDFVKVPAHIREQYLAGTLA